MILQEIILKQSNPYKPTEYGTKVRKARDSDSGMGNYYPVSRGRLAAAPVVPVVGGPLDED